MTDLWPRIAPPDTGAILVSGKAARTAWRRRVAESLDWPVGAVGACETVEALCPGWVVMFMFACCGPAGLVPSGLYASKEGSLWVEHTAAYGETVEELLEEISVDAQDLMELLLNQKNTF